MKPGCWDTGARCRRHVAQSAALRVCCVSLCTITRRPMGRSTSPRTLSSLPQHSPFAPPPAPPLEQPPRYREEHPSRSWSPIMHCQHCWACPVRPAMSTSRPGSWPSRSARSPRRVEELAIWEPARGMGTEGRLPTSALGVSSPSAWLLRPVADLPRRAQRCFRLVQRALYQRRKGGWVDASQALPAAPHLQ